MTQPLWIAESDVVAALSLEEALPALEAGLARLATGEGTTIPKAMHAWSGGSMHTLGAYDAVVGLAAFKSWINTPRGAVAILTLLDADKGTLRAVIEAGVLGALRTSGVTGLATRELADVGADEITIIGSGRQAQLQLAAIALVRPPTLVRFWSPTAERREAAADIAAKRFGLKTKACVSLVDALRDAPIVTTVTRAREPFLKLAQLAEGAHVNAVGAILPGHAEVEGEIIAFADAVVCDSVDAVTRSSQEFASAAVIPGNRLAEAKDLSSLLASPGLNRPPAPRVTLFKSVGIGASDLAIAAEVITRCERRGLGRAFDAPVPVLPRWRADSKEN